MPKTHTPADIKYYARSQILKPTKCPSPIPPPNPKHAITIQHHPSSCQAKSQGPHPRYPLICGAIHLIPSPAIHIPRYPLIMPLPSQSRILLSPHPTMPPSPSLQRPVPILCPHISLPLLSTYPHPVLSPYPTKPTLPYAKPP